MKTELAPASLDEVIRMVRSESDVALLAAKAALGADGDPKRLNIPRRFPDDGLQRELHASARARTQRGDRS